ncbi:sushi repeat-containing protein SRPX2 [Gadus chalcogrammus]|uniref:sushi repeat-containing protein SRPX2 n=1 Tax=Gadus chalcogrammus TaxID=1042646 RepID=UPI0024C4A810|nr:sushi repeat-containing protein SRPX2 [Gadus chalcogrammus]
MAVTMHGVVVILIFYVTVSAGTEEMYSNYELVSEEEPIDEGPRLDYNDPTWCHPLSLANGELSCVSPRGRSYSGTLGTRCEMTCDRGYKLVGKSSVHCLANRRWSGTAFCRQIRCRVLHLNPHGRYTCSQGFVVDSRCDYTCKAGYRIIGQHSRTCQPDGSWSNNEPVCTDDDPPKIRCPMSRAKYADPGALTAKVAWDPPVATDTADKAPEVILVGQEPNTAFKEGSTVVRYKVYDLARNRAGCKFIVRVVVRRCEVLNPPLHGYLSCSSDTNNYGAVCEYHCEGGHERTGTSSRVCQFNHSWSGAPAECRQMEFRTNVKTVSALMDQFYENRRLLIVSTPSLMNQEYRLQNLMIQKSRCGLDLRHVTVIELLGSAPQERGRIKTKPLHPGVIEGLRQAFRISRSYFSMLILDKNGVDRERFITPMSSDELFAYIDDFLLDEEERDRLEIHRDFCV